VRRLSGEKYRPLQGGLALASTGGVEGFGLGGGVEAEAPHPLLAGRWDMLEVAADEFLGGDRQVRELALIRHVLEAVGNVGLSDLADLVPV
jgi:hypothetical protein